MERSNELNPTWSISMSSYHAYLVPCMDTLPRIAQQTPSQSIWRSMQTAGFDSGHRIQARQHQSRPPCRLLDVRICSRLFQMRFICFECWILPHHHLYKLSPVMFRLPPLVWHPYSARRAGRRAHLETRWRHHSHELPGNYIPLRRSTHSVSIYKAILQPWCELVFFVSKHRQDLVIGYALQRIGKGILRYI